MALGVTHITSPQIVRAHPTTALGEDTSFEDIAAVIFAVGVDICVGYSKLICSNPRHVPEYGSSLHTMILAVFYIPFRLP
jgi:hypothetical protein